MAKLGKIHLGNVSYDGLPLNEVLKQLAGQCKLLDPEHQGINLLINNNPDRSGQPAAAPTPGHVGSFIIKIPSLTDVRLADVLDAIVLVADHPLKYSVQDFAIVFSARGPETPPLSGRTFRVDPNTFYSGLDQYGERSFGNNGAVLGVVNAFTGAGDFDNAGESVGGGAGGETLDQAAPAAKLAGQRTMTFRLNDPKPEAELTSLLSEAGVNLVSTKFIYNAKAGVFVIRATPDQLTLVNRLVLKLNGYSPQEIQNYDTGFVKGLNTKWSATENSTNLFTRTFRVDPNTFYLGLEIVGASSSPTSPSMLARSFFITLGVNFTNPPGKAIFFNDKLGYLFVKATGSDLDTIEKALQALNQVPPQLHIKARFYEAPKGTLKDFGKYLNATDPRDGKPMGVLTSQNAKAVLEALRLLKNIEILGEPEITTLSGRQTQMRATEMTTVATNIVLDTVRTNQYGKLEHTGISTQTGVFETGPVLDLVSYVLADGYTINLAAIPSVKEFLGYDTPTNNGDQFSNDNEVHLPKILPKFWNQQFVATVNVWDDQTLLLGGLQEPVADSEKGFKSVAQDKELLVFITATIVDPAGRRVHSDDEMPFAQDGIPTQPERKMSRMPIPSSVGDFPPYHNGDPLHPGP